MAFVCTTVFLNEGECTRGFDHWFVPRTDYIIGVFVVLFHDAGTVDVSIVYLVHRPLETQNSNTNTDFIQHCCPSPHAGHYEHTFCFGQVWRRNECSPEGRRW